MGASGRANLVTGHRRDAATGRALCGQHLAGPNPGAQGCAPCRRHREETEAARQTSTLSAMRKAANVWDQRPLDVYGDRAGALRPGDAYTRPDCADRHHVATVAERGRGSHTDLLVHLPGEDRLTEVRIRRDRPVTVQRPLTTTEKPPRAR
ncbi:hypothetical protein [Streptomyces pinistramenti]|uniref:hypothetical protein n=1 Tax=Streptomyces pinistramenti TaxID=2884812 RepID=UPI001D06480D|nr:hypothetical protein [Streptomyces pinistramenti]MCB5908123.1 hypothetical protein [Streptomyces pinistramenti]